jgi:hypothetical protein
LPTHPRLRKIIQREESIEKRVRDVKTVLGAVCRIGTESDEVGNRERDVRREHEGREDREMAEVCVGEISGGTKCGRDEEG